jgi:glycosyltransferase involved in cell wall biosynthesis
MKERKVLVFAFHFPPVASAGVFRTLRYVKYLPDCAWTPLVLTSQVEGSKRGCDPALAEQVPETVSVVRTNVWSPDERLKLLFGRKPRAAGSNGASHNGSAATGANGSHRKSWSVKRWFRNTWDLAFLTPDERIWWIGPAVRTAVRIARQQRVTALYSTGPPHSTHVVAALARKLTGLPLVCDFRDPWARACWRPTDRNPWGFRLNPVFERLVIRSADRVILNTPRLADDFRAAYPRMAHKFTAIPNGFDPDDLRKVAALAAEEHASTRTGPPCLCHPGALYNQRDPRPVVDAVLQLAREGCPVTFEQIGVCDSRFSLPEYVAQRSAGDRVVIRGQVSHDEALRRMAAADLFLLIQPNTDLQVPGKLFEMMMFGKPIVALTDDGATADIVRDFRLGQVSAPGETTAIAQAIRAALRDEGGEEDRRQRQEALRAFDGRNLTQRLAETLEQALQQRRARR